MSPGHGPLDVQLERWPEQAILEFVLFAPPAGGPWSAAPGFADTDAAGCPRRLHFAPRRWLLPAADAALRSELAAAVAGGLGACVDVTGKWLALRARGPDARRALASTIDIDAVLAGRECAAVTLFDCPAIVLRDGGGYRLWVAASYAASFEAAVERVRR